MYLYIAIHVLVWDGDEYILSFFKSMYIYVLAVLILPMGKCKNYRIPIS